jgi:hypothetical protein
VRSYSINDKVQAYCTHQHSRSDIENYLLPSTEVLPRLSLEGTLPIVKHWYENCLTHHSTCNGQRSSYSLPSRLLDISTNNQGHIRLVDTSCEPIKAPYTYMTLSHKWGTAQPFQLEAKTELKLKEKCPVTELPQTFQDAVKVVAALGVSYLWIDSLCIKQDSIEDWTIESSRMADIYGGSQCNIGATGGLDNTQGLFFDSDNTQLTLETLELSYKTEHLSFVLVQSDLKIILDKEPLNVRAWVYQERWLAPSMVHFARSQLFWECHTMSACESWPHGLPLNLGFDFQPWRADISHGLNPRGLYTRSFKMSGIAKSDAVIFGLQLWSHILGEYVLCSLTREEDRLVAISGVAKRLQRFVNAEYLAGLWGCHIVPQLLWHTVARPGYRPSKYRAPSWSWASIDGVVLVTSSGLLSDSLIEVIDAKVIRAGAGTTGAVISGYLKVKAEIHCVRIIRIEEVFRIDGLVEGWKIGPKALLDVELTPEQLERSYFCMPVQQHKPDENSHVVKGLILNCINAVESCYERIGVFTIYVSQDQVLETVEGSFSGQLVTII